MPGLDQLKQFNSDVLALGSEAEKRASRGEQIVRVPIPRTVKAIDDSEDFVFGMPEPEEGQLESSGQDQSSPDDFSDITGETSSDAEKSTDDASQESEDAKVDLSSLLTPNVEEGSDVPDLSQFIEEAPQEEIVEEETSIADMSLDDLLGSGDFDTEDVEALDDYDEVAPEASPVEDISEDTSLPDELKKEEYIPGEAILDFIEKPTEEASTYESDVIQDSASSVESSIEDDFSFSGPAINLNEDLPDEFNEIAEIDFSSTPDNSVSEDSFADTPLPDADSFSLDDKNISEYSDFSSATDFSTSEDFSASTNLSDKSTSTESTNFSSPESFSSETNISTNVDFSSDDFTSDDFSSNDFSSDTTFKDTSFESEDNSSEEIFSKRYSDDELNFSFDDEEAESKERESESAEENAPIETYDTSEMEGLDFTVTDENKTDFELANNDFEIPGFSDTVTAKTDKSGRIKLPTPDFSGASEQATVKNALSDSQYKKFRKNLSEYPINVRIAIESLLVKNEFTDDAQFEVVEKILNKVPARQIASHLEKMLDISIPVPRDFERRTAAEYEAYKSSLQYQLRNRIIPGIILGIVSLALIFGLVIFSRNFIYRPLRANSLYKQGYALIQANEYQQSETKFIEATRFDFQKKWFFRYARAYRDHKQYLRAEKMYRNILNYFNHDKIAGIEYARMECDELGNYEKAEEIAKREVLDYHINDKDGILLLGDIYLEWATEKDSSKFEDARRQYASLLELYGDEDMYLARMLRYFIRTDNLHEVLELKEKFYPKGKGFVGEDWTELSGYLLDKLYGQLSPSDEYLRSSIEDVRDMLNRAVKEDETNPIATYNLSRYFIHMNMPSSAIPALEKSITLFKNTPRRKLRDAYKEIDAQRLLGEEFVKQKEFLRAQEAYTEGIMLFEQEKLSSNFQGNESIGKLYADAGDIDYFIRGDLDSALAEYNSAIKTFYDTPSLRYRVGYIHYGKQRYTDAISSFIKANEEKPNDVELLLSLANSLTFRDDIIAASSYYERLVENLDSERARLGVLLPQVRPEQAELVELYLRATNNLGVVQHRLARRTGNSELNAQALVNLSTSLRAWDALTRNQDTMIRLSGSNLAEQNIRYITHPMAEYEPAIYTEISKTLSGEKELQQ